MFEFFSQNLGSIVIGAVLALIVACVVIKLVRDKKKGKSSCGCGGGCAGCPSAGMCHRGAGK